MNYDESQILLQLVKAMDDAAKKLEESFNKRNIEEFNEAKEAVLNFQRQIASLLSEVSKQR